MKSAAECRAEARQALKGNWTVAVLTGLVATILGGAIISDRGPTINSLQAIRQNPGLTQVMQGSQDSWSFFLHYTWGYVVTAALVLSIVQFIIGCIVSIGYAKFNIDLTDGEEIKFNALFRYFPQWKTMFVAGLLQALYVFLWALLLFIPGIIAAYRYSMTGYILAENPELRAGEAITRSKEMMKGNKWRRFCLEFSFIGWILLSTVTLGIGWIWLTPYMEAAGAIFYRDLAPLTKPTEPETQTETQAVEAPALSA